MIISNILDKIDKVHTIHNAPYPLHPNKQFIQACNSANLEQVRQILSVYSPKDHVVFKALHTCIDLNECFVFEAISDWYVTKTQHLNTKERTGHIQMMVNEVDSRDPHFTKVLLNNFKDCLNDQFIECLFMNVLVRKNIKAAEYCLPFIDLKKNDSYALRISCEMAFDDFREKIYPLSDPKKALRCMIKEGHPDRATLWLKERIKADTTKHALINAVQPSALSRPTKKM